MKIKIINSVYHIGILFLNVSNRIVSKIFNSIFGKILLIIANKGFVLIFLILIFYDIINYGRI